MRWWLGALLMAVVLGGCAPTRDVEPPVELMSDIDLATFTFPLDHYRETNADRTAQHEAFLVIFQRCLGRSHIARPQAAIPGRGYERRYGITDEQQARVHGYHTAQPRPAEDQSDQSPLVPAEKSCAEESRRRLYQATTLDTRQRALPERLSHETYQQSIQDSRSHAVATAWSACMHRAGYDYPDPLKANDDPAFTSSQPLDHELAVAVTDVHCKKETNYIIVRVSVEVAYSKRAVELNAATLEQVKRDQEVIHRNVADILAAH